MKIYKVTWGLNHEKKFNDYDEANLFAYIKALYFSDTKINGVIVNRKF